MVLLLQQGRKVVIISIDITIVINVKYCVILYSSIRNSLKSGSIFLLQKLMCVMLHAIKLNSTSFNDRSDYSAEHNISSEFDTQLFVFWRNGEIYILKENEIYPNN